RFEKGPPANRDCPLGLRYPWTASPTSRRLAVTRAIVYFGLVHSRELRRGEATMSADAAILLLDPKYPHNVGQVLRACAAYGVRRLMFTGERMRKSLTE